MIWIRLIIAFLMTIPIISFAEDNFQWNLKAGAFNRIENEQAYIVASFKPYFNYSKFYFALDLEFEFEKSGALREDDWNNWKAIKEKINYIGYGSPTDPFFVRLGQFDDVSLGYGIIVNHFRNDVYYPNTRKLGLHSGYDLGYNGAVFFTEDTVNFKIFGGRIFMRPLYGLDKNNVPEPIRMMQIGISYAIDSDPFYQDSDDIDASFFGNKNQSQAKKTQAYAIDLMIPYYTSDFFSISNYIQYGKIQSIGSGIGYGFIGKIFKYLEYKAEIIYSWDGFLPGYFNSFYDERSTRTTQFEKALNSQNGWGYIAGIGTKLFDNQFTIGVEFSGSRQDSSIFSAYSQLKPTLLKRFYLRFNYQKKKLDSLTAPFIVDKGSLSTIVVAEIGYEITTNASISFRYINNFIEQNGVSRGSSMTEIQTNLLF